MADVFTDNRIKWIKSDGTVLAHDAAAENGATYYAEVTGLTAGQRDFWVGLDWDATDVSAFTLESAGRSSGDLTSYAAVGTGWKSQATALGTKNSAASTSCDDWDVTDAQAPRWRVKRVVTTGGVANVRCRAKVD